METVFDLVVATNPPGTYGGVALDPDGYPAPVMTCPMCHCENTHLKEVVVQQRWWQGIVSNEGAFNVRDDDSFTNHLGSTITIKSWCEWDHDFETILSFEKGRVLITQRVDFTPSIEKDKLFRNEL